MLNVGPLMQFPTLVTTGLPTTNQMIIPPPVVNARATPVGDSVEGDKQTEIRATCGFSAPPAVQSTPLRSAAALCQPGNEAQKQDAPSEAAPQTTLMLRNLPSAITRDKVMDVLRSEGFAKHVVFSYLPMNLRSSGNFGYAFVDFDCANVAEQCKEKLDGFTGWGEPSEAAMEVVWSETQGLDSLIQRYRDSPLMHESVEDELKPAMFKNGVRVAFPPPTKNIRAPRLRRVTSRSNQ